MVINQTETLVYVCVHAFCRDMCNRCGKFPTMAPQGHMVTIKWVTSAFVMISVI